MRKHGRVDTSDPARMRGVHNLRRQHFTNTTLFPRQRGAGAGAHLHNEQARVLVAQLRVDVVVVTQQLCNVQPSLLQHLQGRGGAARANGVTQRVETGLGCCAGLVFRPGGKDPKQGERGWQAVAMVSPGASRHAGARWACRGLRCRPLVPPAGASLRRAPRAQRTAHRSRPLTAFPGGSPSRRPSCSREPAGTCSCLGSAQWPPWSAWRGGGGHVVCECFKRGGGGDRRGWQSRREGVQGWGTPMRHRANGRSTRARAR